MGFFLGGESLDEFSLKSCIGVLVGMGLFFRDSCISCDLFFRISLFQFSWNLWLVIEFTLLMLVTVFLSFSFMYSGVGFVVVFYGIGWTSI